MMIARKILFGVSTLLLGGLLLSGCIDDNLEDCATEFRFVFTHNMLNSDAFGEQVDEVTLYIYDKNGVLYSTVTDQGSHITHNYVMRLNNLPRGEYQFVAWARSNELTNERANFVLPAMTEGKSTLDELTASLQLIQGRREFDSDLNNLLVGHVPTQFVNQSTSGKVTIPLKKVNNSVRIILIENGQEVTTDHYTIRIEEEEGNGVVNSLYEVLPDGKISYTPYYFEKNTAEENEVVQPEERERALIAEFALSRLIGGHEIRLIVEDKTGSTILNKSLLALIELAELEGNASKWNFQEYLDRQDEYAITLFMNGDTSTWLHLTLIINGWVINNVDIDL